MDKFRFDFKVSPRRKVTVNQFLGQYPSAKAFLIFAVVDKLCALLDRLVGNNLYCLVWNVMFPASNFSREKEN